MEFKLNKKYKVNDITLSNCETGDIIIIDKFDESNRNQIYHFTNLNNSTTCWFQPTSLFAESLTEYKEEPIKMENYSKPLEKPQPFIIYGKTHHLISIWEDLKELGYKSIYPKYNEEVCINAKSIRTNTFNIVNSKDDYKELFLNHMLGNGNDIEFHLPQDYSKALYYCKDALSDKYWVKKPEYKIGEWLYFEDELSKGIFKYNGISKGVFDSLESYHLHLRENTFTEAKINIYYCKTEIVKGKATQEQIEEVLSKVAEYKGYKNGITYKGKRDDNTIVVLKELKNFKYFSTLDMLTDGWGSIYSNGKWAEIIYLPEIGGYISEYNQDRQCVSFGCKKNFSKELITQLLSLYRDDLEVDLKIEGNEITKELLTDILNNFPTK